MPALDDLKLKFWDDVLWFNAGDFPGTDPVYDRFDNEIEIKKIDDVDWHEEKPP